TCDRQPGAWGGDGVPPADLGPSGALAAAHGADVARPAAADQGRHRGAAVGALYAWLPSVRRRRGGGRAGHAVDEVIRRLSEAGRRMDHANTRPRDAGTLIILDRSGAQPKVLMGRRHHAHVFLPGTFVFPGGRVDPADRRAPAASTLHPATRDKLMARMRGR